eukprot:CCRYP_011470-RA/>CCRYP_011470-RA protein AED:0.39 eAED:0.39 QI:241/1/1/1/1/1/2/99/907
MPVAPSAITMVNHNYNHMIMPRLLLVPLMAFLSSTLPFALAQSRPRYNVYSLPPFEIKLDVDLWTTVLNGSYLTSNGARRMDAMDNYFSNDDTLDDAAPTNFVAESDPAYALSELKAALSTAAQGNEAASLPSYLLSLFTEYTTSYITTFLHSAFDTDARSAKGWSMIHAVDLQGKWIDVDFWQSEVHFLDGETRLRRLAEGEETFASLTVAFSGTVAVLQGNADVSAVVVDSDDPLATSPQIDRSLIRLAIDMAFSPPDGPYQFLSHVITNSMEDRLYGLKGNEGDLSEGQAMEHDAALLLSGSREVKTRMDLDLFPTAEFVGLNTVSAEAGSGFMYWFGDVQAEKRESIAVFVQGAFLVLFIGGFYIYASYKYRRNHLKWELERYGSRDAILFKRKYKRPRGQRLAKLVSGLQRSRSKDNHSPVTVEIDGVDGFFERELSGLDSSDEDMYDLEMIEERSSLEYCEETQDLEKGLRESYDESNRFKRGLDMNPIDEQSIAAGRGSPTMKAMDDEMKQNSFASSMQPEKIDWNEVLENVVPIPASDAVANLDDRNPTYHITSHNSRSGLLVQRRYVQPASPFDVLYGAAFLHGEADRVEAQRRLTKAYSGKKKIRASPSGRKRKKKKKTLTMKLVTEAMNGQRSKDAIKPMMTIAEVEDGVAGGGFREVFNEEDEDALDSEEEENAESTPDLAQFTPGELRHNPSPMSFYSPSNFMRNLSEKYNLGLFESSSDNGTGFEKVTPEQETIKECDDAIHDDFPVEEGVIFRDFPRQDGTPCIIYNVNEREDRTETQSSHPPSTTDSTVSPCEERLEMVVGTITTSELDADKDEQTEANDDFASKINRILDSKCKQIEERKAMELEMQARRREREGRKRLNAEVEQITASDEGSDQGDIGNELSKKTMEFV